MFPSRGSLEERCISGKMVRWSCHIGEEGNHHPKIMSKKSIVFGKNDGTSDNDVYDAFGNSIGKMWEENNYIWSQEEQNTSDVTEIECKRAGISCNLKVCGIENTSTRTRRKTNGKTKRDKIRVQGEEVSNSIMREKNHKQ